MIDDGTTAPKSSPVFCVSRVKTILAYATAEKLYLMQYPCTRSEDAVVSGCLIFSETVLSETTSDSNVFATER